jgi:hypothetical protein
MHSKYNLAAQYNSLSSSKNPSVNLLIECDLKNSQCNTHYHQRTLEEIRICGNVSDVFGVF